MSSIDATTLTGSRRLLVLFAALSMVLSLLAIGAAPAFGDPPPEGEGPDTITVDGVPYDATQKSGSVSHFETPDENPQEAFTSRHTWEGHGSEHLPCENGIHWVDNTELLTISNCLGDEGEDVEDVEEEDVGGPADNPNHPDYWEAQLGGDLECVKIEGESQTNFVADADYAFVIVKKGSGENAQRVYEDVEAGDVLAPHPTQGDGVGYSYVITCVAADAEAGLDLAEVSVTGACNEDDEFVLIVSSVNASVKVDFNADGDFEDTNETNTPDGDYTITVSGEIDFEATADAGAEFAGDVTFESGTVLILDCEEGNVGGEEELALAVEKSATQNGVTLDLSNAATSNEAIVFMVTITNDSSGGIEITGLSDDVFGTLNGDADCNVGTVLAAAASCSFTFEQTLNTDLTAEQLQVMVDTESHTNVVTVSGVDVDAEADVAAQASLTFAVIPTEVAGIVVTATTTTTTTPAEAGAVTPVDVGAGAVTDEVLATQVEAEQLPFTGIETERLIGLAILLLGGGLLMLRATTGREES